MTNQLSANAALLHFKDERLNQLANFGNVAQFVSFGPDLQQRFSRISGYGPNHRFSAVHDAVIALLEHSFERRVNIRSFRPDDPQGHEFIYGISAPEIVEQQLIRLTGSGLFAILNETVDVNDGGVSGVAHGDVIEFAPGGTPRVVEIGRIVSVDRSVGERLLHCVYGFVPALPKGSDLRIEFSIHPIRRGFASDHTIIWELQEIQSTDIRAALKWPNAFSEFLGDKTFGLLLAYILGFNVPRTTVLARNVVPFTFGMTTGSEVKWIRTAPRLPEPGLFPTVRGWTDPFRFMEDIADRHRIPSVLIQDETPALFSGALLTDIRQNAIIEGVVGFGDTFMRGGAAPIPLDASLVHQLQKLHSKLKKEIGGIRAEWTFDGQTIWLLQLQQEAALSSGQTIVPGEVDSEYEFDVSEGLSGLREMIEIVKGTRVGIKLVGNIGMTSHIADVLRRYRVPSRIVPSTVSDA